ncbi:ABC transporter permease [Paenibacillus sp. NPDC058177]|uniref:ABC transporter permease n=1 Tax=Paenibacillus sp. NPDC058177 TaxID=3346369 RepID=UPI0036D7ECE1
MLKQTLSAEWLKLRRLRIWIVLLALPVASVLIGSANYAMNQGVLQKEWYSLWTQVGLFYSEFFFPVLIAICCAALCRLEHMNKNWNMIMTAPVSVASIYYAKMAICAALLLLVQFFFFLLYIAAGHLLGLPAQFPPEVIGWMVRGWVASLSVAALQFSLSLVIRSFALPIGIGLCAAFAGLGMYVAKLGMFFPHSLLTIGMGVLGQGGLSPHQQFIWVLMNLLYFIILSIYSIRRMSQRDVIA